MPGSRSISAEMDRLLNHEDPPVTRTRCSPASDSCARSRKWSVKEYCPSSPLKYRLSSCQWNLVSHESLWFMFQTYLRQHDNHSSGFGNLDDKFCRQIPRYPRYCNTCPLLHHKPGVVKEACTRQIIELLAHVFVRHPEFSVIAKFVVEFSHPVWCPFLASIAPRT
jgi:hypothetical protein